MIIQISKNLTALQLRAVGIRLGVKQGVVYLMSDDGEYWCDDA